MLPVIRHDSGMPSLTVENYLKAVLQLELKTGEKRISPGLLSARLDLTPGTVTSMLKALAESGLADYVPYEGVQLTESGRILALRMLRRHRLIELFLHSTLDLTWDQVHDEAEELEHSVSDFLIDRIDEYLEHPEVDPHGSPIPAADGIMRGDPSATVPLLNCEVGDRLRFVRVVNQEPDFLRYLSDSGFELGATATVIENSEEIGIVKTDLGERSFTVGRVAAESIRVERLVEK